MLKWIVWNKTDYLYKMDLALNNLQRLILFTNPSARAGYDKMSIFKWSLTGLNSEFSFSWTFCLTKAEEISLSYYLLIGERRMIGFIPFPRALVLCEIQLAWSKNWTVVAVSISYDDNHYTSGTSYKGWYAINPTYQPYTKRRILFTLLPNKIVKSRNVCDPLCSFVIVTWWLFYYAINTHHPITFTCSLFSCYKTLVKLMSVSLYPFRLFGCIYLSLSSVI